MVSFSEIHQMKLHWHLWVWSAKYTCTCTCMYTGIKTLLLVNLSAWEFKAFSVATFEISCTGNSSIIDRVWF